MAKEKRTFISIEIDPEKKFDFSERVRRENRTVTEVILEFIDSYLSKEEPLPLESVVADLQKRVELLEKEKQGNAHLVGESAA